MWAKFSWLQNVYYILISREIKRWRVWQHQPATHPTNCHDTERTLSSVYTPCPSSALSQLCVCVGYLWPVAVCDRTSSNELMMLAYRHLHIIPMNFNITLHGWRRRFTIRRLSPWNPGWRTFMTLSVLCNVTLFNWVCFVSRPYTICFILLWHDKACLCWKCH